MIMILILNFVLAVTFLIAKSAASYAQPLFFVASRMLASGVVMLVIEELRNKGTSQLFTTRRGALKILLFLTIFHGYLSPLLSSVMIPHLTSTKSNLLWALSPFVTAILAYLLYKERLGLNKVAGIVVAFAGLLPSVVLSDNIATLPGGSYIPEAVAFLGTVAASYAWFVFKNVMKEGSSPMLINGFTMALGGTGLMITSYFYESWPTTTLFTSWPMFLGLLAAMSVFSNGVYCNLQGYLLNRYSLTFITLCGFMAPLFGAVLGWYFLSEAINWTFYVAVASVAGGLYLFTKK